MEYVDFSNGGFASEMRAAEMATYFTTMSMDHALSEALLMIFTIDKTALDKGYGCFALKSIISISASPYKQFVYRYKCPRDVTTVPHP